MGQEFTINSRLIEDRLNSLLPSQANDGAGIDFSASTMIIPTIDVTEAAQGSVLRQDLQTSISFTSSSAFEVVNTTTTIINTTGYFRLFGNFVGQGAGLVIFRLTDGATSKIINLYLCNAGFQFNDAFDFNVFILNSVLNLLTNPNSIFFFS